MNALKNFNTLKYAIEMLKSE